jgi:hypothetical protein
MNKTNCKPAYYPRSAHIVIHFQIVGNSDITRSNNPNCGASCLKNMICCN